MEEEEEDGEGEDEEGEGEGEGAKPSAPAEPPAAGHCEQSLS